MDRGELVPDSVTIEMLFERLAKPDAAKGILLDGFPRNTAQAEVLDKALADRGAKVNLAPYIEVRRQIWSPALAAAGSAARRVTPTTSRPSGRSSLGSATWTDGAVPAHR